jgi:hypothetical protein
VPPVDCEKEKTTQHHRGEGNGFGPIQPAEILLFAVFESTKPPEGRLTADSFDRRQLNRAQQSLARRQHLTRAEFEQYFVAPHEARWGPCGGVACASAAALRAVRYAVPEARPPESGPAVCVLDRVDAGDHDAHAALEYSEALKDSMARRSEKLRATLRMRIHASLAEAFGPIISISEAFGVQSKG